MQLPIQSGVRIKNAALETSYPVNLEHRIVESGLGKGQLVTARGIEQVGTGPGVDRGGTVFQGVQYRVMGSKLVSVAADGAVTELGDVGSDGLPAGFTHSFDRLAIRSAEALHYWDGAALTKVTDADLGTVRDVDWIDGYFVTIDGEYVVVTELLDPAQVDALKYGSAEADPDPLTGVMNFREELYAFGRNSIQVFRNVGGTGFPFANVRGAMIPYGCVSANAKCRIGGTFAFIGGARDEPIGVYVAAQGGAVRISDDVIDTYLAEVDSETLVMEGRVFGDEQQIVIHAGDRSLVLALRASQVVNEGAWHIAHSGNFGRYRGRHAVYCYGRHFVGDCSSPALGVLTEATAKHFGATTDWRFDAGLLFNDGRGIIVHAVEIHGQFPRGQSTVFMSMTRDGEVWSNEVARPLQGHRGERVVWRANTRAAQRAGFRFRGAQRVAIVRADIEGEPLAV